jgi:hypothetical protein
MSTLTVGTGGQYATIAAAVAASASGDTIDVNAGTYTNDFLNISHSLTLEAVGGAVALVATVQPPNGKAIIDAGGAGVNVAITGFDLSGATVPDGNGAGIRYEGGNLTLNSVNIHDNQDGLLAAADPNGSITIANSTFANNGAGDGRTHNIYVNPVGNLTVRDSTITGAVVGHEIKSRALSTTIVNNTIGDGTTGTASYEIDLPNGGVADIEGNHIQKGANAQNPIAISFGEEGGVYANSSLTVRGNTLVNDFTAHSTIAVKNDTSVTATVSGNSLSGWTTETTGPVAVSGNTAPATVSAPSAPLPDPTASTNPAPVTPSADGGNATVTAGTLGLPSAPPAFLNDPAGTAASPAPAATVPAAIHPGSDGCRRGNRHGIPGSDAAAPGGTHRTGADRWGGLRPAGEWLLSSRGRQRIGVELRLRHSLC